MDIVLSQTKGWRNDRGRKFIGKDYLFDISNYNFDSIIGCSRINFPNVEYNIAGADGIDGMYEFRYIGSLGTLVKENIVVVGGSVIKDFLDAPVTMHTGLTAGHKCTFAVLNDKLFISNGFDDVLVYDGTHTYEMGAPLAKNLGAAGVLTGAYYYAITYEKDGVELVTGAVSNTVNPSSNSITITCPVGPSGITDRKLYRTEAGGSTLKLLTTLGDNVTTTYVDNIADGSLGAAIPSINSEAPKPKFITVINERLVGVGVSRRPNYLYYSETEIESLFATIGVADVSGQGNDNTGLTGMAEDYDLIVVFSEKRIYTVDLSGETASVKQTTSNVGCLDGHSVAKVPPNLEFKGGLMFVSNEYDVRVFNGNLAVNLATSFDNLATENFSAQLNKDDMRLNMENEELEGRFFDYKYHLIIDKEIYIYDIRIMGWSKYFIKTASYAPEYRKFGVLGEKFYIGQKNTGIVEEMYKNELYRDESVSAFFETSEYLVGDDYKYWKDFVVYYGNTGNVTQNITVTPDNNSNLSKSFSFSFTSDGFDSAYFDPTYFQTATNTDDYRVAHINEYARWMRFRFDSNTKFNFRGFKMTVDAVSNKE